MSNSETVNVETMKKFLEAFNRHDLDAIMEFFAEDCSMDLPRGQNPWGTRLIGKEQVRGKIGNAPHIYSLQYLMLMLY